MPRKKLTRAERNIKWIEDHCHIPEGRDVAKKTVLRPWQREILVRIYDNPAKTRMAIISFAKKNAKSTLSAFLTLLHLAGPEAVQNTQIPSTAQSRDQAAVLFKLAANCVRCSPKLREHIVIRETVKELACPGMGTLYQALSADASTAHGKSPIFAIHDELGQVRGPVSELFNAVENAMAAHDDPLSIVISTQAPTDNDLLSILIDDGLKEANPRTVVILYTADTEIDPFSEEAIKQANPAYGDFLNAEEIKEQANRAKRMPSQEALYRNYTLNQRVEANNPFVSAAVWKDNGLEPEDLDVVFGGLDLASTNDLTAFVMVSPVGGRLMVKPVFWLPGDGLEERSRQDRVPYDLWKEQGFLRTTPGSSVEYEYVAQEIVDAFAKYDIRKLAFDRYNMKHLRPWLIKAGMPESVFEERFEDFGQGFVSMSPALRVLESLLLNKKVCHGMNPILTMCAAQAIVRMDEAGNRKLDKKRSRGKIDGMVALAMAASMASDEMNRKPVIPVDVSTILETMSV